MRKEFSANERDEEQTCGKDRAADEESHFGMSEAPIEALGVALADPIEDAVLLFLDAFLENVPSHHGNNRKRKDERADEGEGHGVRHGMEEFSGRAGERVNGEVTGDDDGDGIENGAVDVAGGGEDDFVKFVVLALAQAELTVNVLDHDDGAVNDDAEVDGTDGEEVGRFASGLQEDEGKEQREG